MLPIIDETEEYIDPIVSPGIKDSRNHCNSCVSGRRAMVNKVWCQEIVRKWFYAKDKPPHAQVFTEPRCQNHVATWYLLYRWLIFAAWAAIIVCSFFELGSIEPLVYYEKWPIYLTNWDLVLGVSQGLLGCLLVSKRWKLQQISGFDPFTLTTGSMERFYWFLYVVTTNVAICVTVTYWLSVYNPKIHHMDPLNIMLHVCNSILMMIDFFVTNIPFRLRNFWWPLIIAFFYMMFSLIYYLAGGTDKHGCSYIYKILDWKKPIQSLLVCMGEVVFMIILHSAMCLLAKVKDHVYFKIDKKFGKQLLQTRTPSGRREADIV